MLTLGLVLAAIPIVAFGAGVIEIWCTDITDAQHARHMEALLQGQDTRSLYERFAPPELLIAYLVIATCWMISAFFV